jgi:hypothetical protein
LSLELICPKRIDAILPLLARFEAAPVLTLWAAVIAQRPSFDEDEALTLGTAGPCWPARR